jgi:hypothetical protein
MEERNKLVSEAARLLQPLEGVKNWDMAHKLAQGRMIKEWETFYYNWVIHICLIAQNNGC